MAEVRFAVSQIHCGGCEARIEVGLSRVEGVRRVSAEQATQTVAVSYNERAVGERAGRAAGEVRVRGAEPPLIIGTVPWAPATWIGFGPEATGVM